MYVITQTPLGKSLFLRLPFSHHFDIFLHADEAFVELSSVCNLLRTVCYVVMEDHVLHSHLELNIKGHIMHSSIGGQVLMAGAMITLSDFKQIIILW